MNYIFINELWVLSEKGTTESKCYPDRDIAHADRRGRIVCGANFITQDLNAGRTDETKVPPVPSVQRFVTELAPISQLSVSEMSTPYIASVTAAREVTI